MLDVFLILMGILCLITGLALHRQGAVLCHPTVAVAADCRHRTGARLFRPHAGQQIQRRNALGNTRMPCRNPHRAVLHALGYCTRPVFRGFYRRTFRRQGNPAGSEVGTGFPVRLPLRHGTEMRVVRILRMGVCIGTALT